MANFVSPFEKWGRFRPSWPYCNARLGIDFFISIRSLLSSETLHRKWFGDVLNIRASARMFKTLAKPFSMQGRATRLLPIFIYRGNSANANSKESNVLKVFFSWSLHHFNSILAMCRSSLLLVQMLHSSQTLEDTSTTSNARPRKLGCRHKAPPPHCRRRPYEEVQHTGQKF